MSHGRIWAILWNDILCCGIWGFAHCADWWRAASIDNTSGFGWILLRCAFDRSHLSHNVEMGALELELEMEGQSIVQYIKEHKRKYFRNRGIKIDL
jgi:hypothetical protein